MKISGKNQESGEEFKSESDYIDNVFVESMSVFGMAEERIKGIVDALNISTDAKSLLYSFSKVTIQVGEKIVKIGRKIIDYIFRVLTEFLSASFGMVFGAIAGFLISSIPVLGVVLRPLFTPIAIALGLVAGLKEDLKDKALARRVAEINAKFNPLNA